MTRSWLKRKKLCKITVHLDNGESFEGMLAEVAPDGLLLRGAVLLGDPEVGLKDTALTGETWLPRLAIKFVQGEQ
jgi:hypothetical protein